MMHWIQTRIGIEGRGPSQIDGVRAQCGDCTGQQWLLFGLGGGTAPHAQCTDCGAVYCLHPGKCQSFTTFTLGHEADADTVHPVADQERGA